MFYSLENAYKVKYNCETVKYLIDICNIPPTIKCLKNYVESFGNKMLEILCENSSNNIVLNNNKIPKAPTKNKIKENDQKITNIQIQTTNENKIDTIDLQSIHTNLKKRILYPITPNAKNINMTKKSKPHSSKLDPICWTI